MPPGGDPAAGGMPPDPSGGMGGGAPPPDPSAGGGGDLVSQLQPAIQQAVQNAMASQGGAGGDPAMGGKPKAVKVDPAFIYSKLQQQNKLLGTILTGLNLPVPPSILDDDVEVAGQPGQPAPGGAGGGAPPPQPGAVPPLEGVQPAFPGGGDPAAGGGGGKQASQRLSCRDRAQALLAQHRELFRRTA